MPSQVSASVIEFRYVEVLLETAVQLLQIRTMVTCILYTVCSKEILALPERNLSVDVRVVVFDPRKAQNVHADSMEFVSLIRMNDEFGQPEI
jgi:hypothetical protein